MKKNRAKSCNFKVFFTITVYLVIYFSSSTESISKSALPLEAYGVWDSNDGSDFDTNSYSYLKGISASFDWKDIQPTDEKTYKWKKIQEAIDRATIRNQYMFISINVGPDAPDWIYSKGVPKVLTKDSEHNWKYYPYYISNEYKSFYYNFIREMGRFIQSQPLEKLNKIAFVQVKTGCTGDEVAYKGDVIESKYAIEKNSDTWKTFRLEAFSVYKETFLTGANPIPLLFNNIEFEDYPDEWNWVMENIGVGFGFKGGAYVRGHHLSNEKSFVESWKKYTINPQGLVLFSRQEMDQTWKKPLYSINKELGFYWGAISGLNSGLSLWNITKSALKEAKTNESIQETFNFFNKYANQIYPENSNHAFIALHEGLDSADTVKFPENIYGKASQNNLDRYRAICNDPNYSKRGAKMDDLKSASYGQVAQRDNQSGYNDAGWDIWSTNYSRFITQIDPENESIGLFRIGGELNNKSSIYARFARSFEHSTGKNTMYFKLEDGFYKKPAGKVKVSIIYYDNIKDSKWDFYYDAGLGNFKSAQTIVCEGSKTWKKVEIIINDAVMLHNGPKNSDFAIANSDNLDDIFHLIEIEKM